MKISLLFFGATAAAARTREKEAEVVEGTAVSDVVELLKEQVPNLKKHKLLIAVNEEYVSMDSELKAGDKIAVFTPVSGG